MIRLYKDIYVFAHVQISRLSPRYNGGCNCISNGQSFQIQCNLSGLRTVYSNLNLNGDFRSTCPQYLSKVWIGTPPCRGVQKLDPKSPSSDSLQNSGLDVNPQFKAIRPVFQNDCLGRPTVEPRT